jgi:hypothetical protein
MEVKVAKTREGFLLSSLPPELASCPSVEIYPLKGGIFLLCAKGAIGGASGAGSAPAGSEGREGMTGKERLLLQKLAAIRFERRTPSEVGKALSKEEKATLDSLMAKGLVSLLRGRRYNDGGVYNISDYGYAATRAAPLPPPAPANEKPLPLSSPEHLERKGWMIVEGEAEARNFAAAFPDKMKSGEVRGTRGFDKRYYFVRSHFLLSMEKKALAALEKDRTDEELAAELRVEPECARALLAHLCESGDALEKQRGRFARA